MVRRLRWKEKVVISILSMLLVCTNGLAQHNANGSDALEKRVTLKRQAISFEEVLRQLSVQTRLYFIYNSNTIAANKSIAISFHQQTLATVLTSLEEEMNVTFRIEGKYIIVKKGLLRKEISTPASVVMFPRQAKRANHSLSTFASARSAKDLSRKTVREYPFTIPYQTLQKNLLHLNSGFSVVDTSVIRKHSLLQITNPKRGRQLFTSIRMIANEFSGGIEIHAGIPSLYAVVNGGLMTEGYFRYGYGVGTSVSLKSKLTFKPIYTFATVKEKQDYVVDAYANITISDGLRLTGRHHQLKFIFQYQLSPKVQIHVGPTFNFLKTSYTFEKSRTLAYDVVTAGVASPTNQRYEAPTLWRQRSIYLVGAPPDSYTLKSWSGFEAGISYLIKFPRR